MQSDFIHIYGSNQTQDFKATYNRNRMQSGFIYVYGSDDG